MSDTSEILQLSDDEQNVKPLSFSTSSAHIVVLVATTDHRVKINYIFPTTTCESENENESDVCAVSAFGTACFLRFLSCFLSSAFESYSPAVVC